MVELVRVRIKLWLSERHTCKWPKPLHLHPFGGMVPTSRVLAAKGVVLMWLQFASLSWLFF